MLTALFFFSLLVIAPATHDVLVGINYFAGWWQGAGDKWIVNKSVHWLTEYPDRTPLLGKYNTQETLDKEIDAASNYSVDFFQMLYYDNYPVERAPGGRNLNRGIKYFMSSPNAHKMKFFITWCNSYPLFILHNETEWLELIHQAWLPAFKHPSYLRVGGNLVFKVINAGSFYKNCNVNATLVAYRWNLLRRIVKQQGLGDIVLGAGVGADTIVNDPQTQFGYDGYNFTDLYAQYNPNGIAHYVYPWKKESDYVRQWRHKHASEGVLPFVPMVMSGWDPRPWNERRPSYKFPTAAQWKKELEYVLEDYVLHPHMGIPTGGGKTQKVFNIYAWNEFGEGGIMAPTTGWNYTRLAAIKEIVRGAG